MNIMLLHPIQIASEEQLLAKDHKGEVIPTDLSKRDSAWTSMAESRPKKWPTVPMEMKSSSTCSTSLSRKKTAKIKEEVSLVSQGTVKKTSSTSLRI